MRPVLERASARITASWTVAGALAKLLIESLGIQVRSAVTNIGGVSVKAPLLRKNGKRHLIPPWVVCFKALKKG